MTVDHLAALGEDPHQLALMADDTERWFACYEPERPADMKVCYLLTCRHCHTKARLDLAVRPDFLRETFSPDVWDDFVGWAMGPVPA